LPLRRPPRRTARVRKRWMSPGHTLLRPHPIVKLLDIPRYPLSHSFVSPLSVIPTGMADFRFRSRRANVGHGVEGPRQHLNHNQAPRASNPLDRRVAGESKDPGANHPQNNSSPNPFLRPNPPTGDFNRHERLFPLFSSRLAYSFVPCLFRDGLPAAGGNGWVRLPFLQLGVGALAPTFHLPVCHPERSSPTFSFAPQFGASGCGVEGPWQAVKSYRAHCDHRNPRTDISSSAKGVHIIACCIHVLSD